MMDGKYPNTHEGKFVDVNPAMVKMFGYSSKEEMLKVDIKNELYFAPEERGSHILDTGQEEMEVYQMRFKYGLEIWVEDHGSDGYYEQGKVIYHEGMLRDITETQAGRAGAGRHLSHLRGGPGLKTWRTLWFDPGHHWRIDAGQEFPYRPLRWSPRLLHFPYYADESDGCPPPAGGQGLTGYDLRSGNRYWRQRRYWSNWSSGEVDLVGSPVGGLAGRAADASRATG